MFLNLVCFEEDLWLYKFEKYLRITCIVDLLFHCLKQYLTSFLHYLYTYYLKE